MTPPTHPLQEGGFDPLAMLRRARGDGSDVRGIKLRMLWLRQRVPEARVTTSVVSLDANTIVMAAAIALPDGGEGSGHAASRVTEGDDLAALIETTELRAIGRALDILGYVVLDHQDGDTAPDRPEPEPADREPTPITRERPERPSREEPARQEAPREEPSPSKGNPPGHVQAIRSLRERGSREQPPRPEPVPEPPQERPSPAGRPATSSTPPAARPAPRQVSPTPPPDDAEPELEDISWTAFWSWARATYQLTSKVQLEELLGQQIGNKPPGEVRELLREHFADGNPGEID